MGGEKWLKLRGTVIRSGELGMRKGVSTSIPRGLESLGQGM